MSHPPASLRSILFFVACLSLAACSGERAADPAHAGHAAETAAQADEVAAPAPGAARDTALPLRIVSPWTRALPSSAPVAAGFMVLRNGAGGEERLLDVRTVWAERAEIHEMQADAEGVMRMRRMEAGLSVPGNQAVSLRPGGYHLMFFGPDTTRWQAGARVPVTLVFEHAGEIEVELAVVVPGEEPVMSDPAGQAHDHAHDGHGDGEHDDHGHH